MIFETLLQYKNANQPIAYCQWEDGDGLDVGYVQELSKSEVSFSTINPEGQSDGARTLPLKSVYRLESIPDYMDRLKLFSLLEPPLSESKGEYTRSPKVIAKRLRKAAETGECVSLTLNVEARDDFRVVRVDKDFCELEEYGDHPLKLRSSLVARISQIEKMTWRRKAEDCVTRVWKTHREFPEVLAPTTSLLIDTLLNYKASQVPVGIYHRENAESFKVGILTEITGDQIAFSEIDPNGQFEGDSVLPFTSLYRIDSMPDYIARLSHFAKIDPPIEDHNGETTTSPGTIKKRIREAMTTGECITLWLKSEDENAFRIIRAENDICEAQVFSNNLFNPVSTIVTRLSQIERLRRRSEQEDRATSVWKKLQRPPLS